jgi:hypothetical protein
MQAPEIASTSTGWSGSGSRCSKKSENWKRRSRPSRAPGSPGMDKRRLRQPPPPSGLLRPISIKAALPFRQDHPNSHRSTHYPRHRRERPISTEAHFTAAVGNSPALKLTITTSQRFTARAFLSSALPTYHTNLHTRPHYPKAELVRPAHSLHIEAIAYRT